GRCSQRYLQSGGGVVRSFDRSASLSWQPAAAVVASDRGRSAASARGATRGASRLGGHLPEGDEQGSLAALSDGARYGGGPAAIRQRSTDSCAADGHPRAHPPLVPSLPIGCERAGGGADRLRGRLVVSVEPGGVLRAPNGTRERAAGNEHARRSLAFL